MAALEIKVRQVTTDEARKIIGPDGAMVLNRAKQMLGLDDENLSMEIRDSGKRQVLLVGERNPKGCVSDTKQAFIKPFKK